MRRWYECVEDVKKKQSLRLSDNKVAEDMILRNIPQDINIYIYIYKYSYLEEQGYNIDVYAYRGAHAQKIQKNPN